MKRRRRIQETPALAGARRLLKMRKAAHAAQQMIRRDPLSAEKLAATALLGAALGSVPGLIDRLFDGPALVVVLESPDGEWADEMAKNARVCFASMVAEATAEIDDGKGEESVWAPCRHRGDYAIYVYSNGRRGAPMVGAATATAAIADMQSVIGIAASPKRDLPELMLRAVDHRIATGMLDADLLDLVVAAVTGSRPRTNLPTELLRKLDLDDIRLAVHRGRSADGCIARLDSLLRSRVGTADDRPLLQDLHGYGAAREFGIALAKDIQAFARGELAAASLPRGAVFWGPSGVGKTMLATAIADQAGVPIVLGSLGRWQSAGEAHLGTTLKAMRKFFEDALKLAPCIAFVDELDSFGDRSRFADQHRDYSTQVVNAFLECLDGAEKRNGVVLLGATNNRDRIDPAITRSGRFDRMIEIGLPSKDDLVSIFRHHLGADLKDVDLLAAAGRALGATGADCAAWVRNARSEARRLDRPVEPADLLSAIDASVTACDRETEERIAIHESGHSIVGHDLGFELGIITTRSASARGRAYAAVATTKVMTRKALEDLLAIFLAGRVAESLSYGCPSAGAGSDLEAATALAWDMHHRWGLGERLAVLPQGSLLGDRTVVEQELQRAAARAGEILARRMDALQRLSRALLEKSALDGREAAEIIGSAEPDPPTASGEVR